MDWFLAMHSECTQIDLPLLIGVLIAESVFAFAYNRWVANHQAKNGGIYTAFYVAGGVLVTVMLMAPVIGWQAAGLVLLGFAGSGLPMILGSMHRHTNRIDSTNQAALAGMREMLHQDYRQDGCDGATTEE